MPWSERFLRGMNLAMETSELLAELTKVTLEPFSTTAIRKFFPRVLECRLTTAELVLLRTALDTRLLTSSSDPRFLFLRFTTTL